MRSVLQDTQEVLEVVVVDDGSHDGSAEHVRREFPAVKVIKQANAGVAAARNAGIAATRGDWIAFLDADDVWLPGKLAAQHALAQAHPEARLIYTAWQVWSDGGVEPSAELLSDLQRRASQPEAWVGASGWIYPELLLDCVVWTSTVLVQRSVLDEVGCFDPTLRVGEDYDLWLRASRVTPILRVCRPYALYRMHSESITKRVPEKNYKGDVIHRALATWGYASPDGTRADKTRVDRGLARTWADYASAHLVAGNTVLARSAALRSLKTFPWHLLGWKVLAKSCTRAPFTRAVRLG